MAGKKRTTQAVAIVEEKKDMAVEGLISQAIAANLDVEKLERLFALRVQVKAENAREEYVMALSRFQEECPVIEKTKKVLNKDGSLRYQYAPLESIVKQIQKPIADNGLSYRWDTKEEAGKITAIAIVTHKLGHSEQSSFSVPIDTEGYMTAPQKAASALTFAKRYSLCNALGISTGEEDTDATDVGKEKEVKSPKAKIVFLLRVLKQKNKTREEVEEAVKRLTQLELKDENLGEIVSRLEVLVQETHEN
jgi:hypothetical protein